MSRSGSSVHCLLLPRSSSDTPADAPVVDLLDVIRLCVIVGWASATRNVCKCSKPSKRSGSYGETFYEHSHVYRLSVILPLNKVVANHFALHVYQC
jgi:hypothetical protein